VTSPYMPLFIADYMADAAHLTTEEHGAYLLLIMTYWQRGKPLDNSNERLANVVRMPNERWTEVRKTLSDFFQIEGDIWTHKRIEQELDRFKAKSDKAKRAAKASVNKRKLSVRSAEPQRTFNHTDTDTDTDKNKNTTLERVVETPPPKPVEPAAVVLSSFYKLSNDYVLQKFPDLETKSRAPITLWEVGGADFEKHVKPAVDAAVHQKTNPESFGYFTPIVKQFMTGMQQPKTEYRTPEEIFKSLYGVAPT